MANESIPLSVEDMENISEAILRLVANYPDLPFEANSKTIQWQNVDDTEGIGLYTLQGGIYLRRYLNGSYRGQFPFRILYKCNPTSNKTRLNSQELVSDLARWLEKCTATFTDERLKLEKIERTSPVFKNNADESGSEMYTCTLRAEYFFKKGR